MSERASHRPDRRQSEEIARSWTADLVGRFRSAEGAAQREQVLRELDRPLLPDEDSALELYRLQPIVASAPSAARAARPARRGRPAALGAPHARGAGTQRQRAAFRAVPRAGPVRPVGTRHPRARAPRSQPRAAVRGAEPAPSAALARGHRADICMRSPSCAASTCWRTWKRMLPRCGAPAGAPVARRWRSWHAGAAGGSCGPV